jgi:DNA-binding NarL/FixJ family response regulator
MTTLAQPRSAGDPDRAGTRQRPRVTIVIVEDHALVREGLRLIVEGEPDLEIVGEAADPESAFEVIERTRPLVVLVDITLGAVDGIPFLRRLAVRFPASRTLAVTMHSDGETVRQAFLAGAAGYIVKGASRVELLSAIRAVARGERYIHSAVAGAVLDDSLRWLRHGGALSPREREILRLLASGRGAPAIARELGISVNTVRRHIANLSDKLGVHGRVALARYALEHEAAD